MFYEVKQIEVWCSRRGHYAFFAFLRGRNVSRLEGIEFWIFENASLTRVGSIGILVLR